MTNMTNKISNGVKLEIIMFNMSSYSEWENGVANRNYHILNNLLQHSLVARIIAIDFLPFTFKRAVRNYIENVISKKTPGVKQDFSRQTPGVNHAQKSKIIYRDLTTKCTKVDGYPAEFYVFSTIDSIFSHKRVIKKLNKALEKISKLPKYPSTQVTRVIWSYFPMFVNYFGGIKSDLTVFDAVDNWIEHPSFVNYKKTLKKNYKIIARKSDLIFTVAEPLLDFFKRYGRKNNLYWIRNGIDFNHFITTTGSDPVVDAVNKIHRPIIGYVGTIQNRVDIDLVKYIAGRHKNKSFVFIGPVWKDAAIEKLKKYTNVYFLGRKPHKVIPAYIKSFDVAIIPHKLDEFIKYTYSLKMLEYLARGKPVVSARTHDVELFSDYIYIAHNYEDFSVKLDTAIRSDTIELQKKRVERAKQEDWELKVGEMVDIIRRSLLENRKS